MLYLYGQTIPNHLAWNQNVSLSTIREDFLLKYPSCFRHSHYILMTLSRAKSSGNCISFKWKYRSHEMYEPHPARHLLLRLELDDLLSFFPCCFYSTHHMVWQYRQWNQLSKIAQKVTFNDCSASQLWLYNFCQSSYHTFIGCSIQKDSNCSGRQDVKNVHNKT